MGRDTRSVSWRRSARPALGIRQGLRRCACTPYAGMHGRQAEQAARSLMEVSNLLPATSELVQEPLRRAVGDKAAKDIGEALAAEAAQGLGPGPAPPVNEDKPRAPHADGSWCRWEGAA